MTLVRRGGRDAPPEVMDKGYEMLLDAVGSSKQTGWMFSRFARSVGRIVASILLALELEGRIASTLAPFLAAYLMMTGTFSTS